MHFCLKAAKKSKLITVVEKEFPWNKVQWYETKDATDFVIDEISNFGFDNLK